MIPEDCQLQDLFLCLHAISKFSVIVHGCLDCFSQTLNLHIFMCWYSSATYLLTCWAEAKIPHPKFTLQLQPLNWMAQSVIPPTPEQFFLTLWEVEFRPFMSQKLWSSFIFDTIPHRILISTFDSFALENTPGLRLKIMTFEKLAARGQA